MFVLMKYKVKSMILKMTKEEMSSFRLLKINSHNKVENFANVHQNWKWMGTTRRLTIYHVYLDFAPDRIIYRAEKSITGTFQTRLIGVLWTLCCKANLAVTIRSRAWLYIFMYCFYYLFTLLYLCELTRFLYILREANFLIGVYSDMSKLIIIDCQLDKNIPLRISW